MGEHLRKARMDRGLLQRKAAQLIGVSTETVRNWELGHTEPALRCWPAIIAFLGFVPFEVGESLGERIVAWRKLNGMPRSELADRLGVDESTVWRWEAGETEPTGEPRDALGSVLDDT